jgi:hypothetical protein
MMTTDLHLNNNSKLPEMTAESQLDYQQNWQNLLHHLPFTLKKQQKKALSKIWQFLASSEQFFLLGGYAGTGKSTIVFAIIKELVLQQKRVVLTATTNKAVAILKKVAAENGLFDVHCITIHQLLGLGIVNQGQEKVLAQTSPSSVHLYQIIFLDECSMVGTDLWTWIERAFDNNLFNKRKLILMGDPAQLNPVGEKRSPSFQVKNRAILTEVVRQAGESPLLDFVTASRQFVPSKTDLFIPFSCYHQGEHSEGAFKVKEKTLIKYALKKIRQEFVYNPDCFRILCYTNKRVEYYNQMIRNSLYGVDADQFVLGERLITKKPVVAPDGKTIVLPTSCEVTVQKISETRHYGYQVWQLTVKTDEGLLKQLLVLNKAEEKRYQQELTEKHQSAIRNPMLWRKYYWWKDDVFAQVWNCFALTIHNSQGSTFDEGGVDGNDILTRLFVGESDESYQQKLKEHNRLYYVGNSRFRHRVLFIPPSSKRLNRLDY